MLGETIEAAVAGFLRPRMRGVGQDEFGRFDARASIRAC